MFTTVLFILALFIFTTSFPTPSSLASLSAYMFVSFSVAFSLMEIVSSPSLVSIVLPSMLPSMTTLSSLSMMLPTPLPALISLLFVVTFSVIASL